MLIDFASDRVHLGREFAVGGGLQQGSVLPPLLFDIIMDRMYESNARYA